jgi:hypothetical protein
MLKSVMEYTANLLITSRNRERHEIYAYPARRMMSQSDPDLQVIFNYYSIFRHLSLAYEECTDIIKKNHTFSNTVFGWIKIF